MRSVSSAADDEPISRMDLKELLTEGGYTVVYSTEFDAENCKLYHLDLVLLDIKMPFLDDGRGQDHL